MLEGHLQGPIWPPGQYRSHRLDAVQG